MNINKIADILNNNYKTTITTITKCGVQKTAIVINNGTDVSPTFYPYDYEGTEEEIAMMIISTIKNMRMPSIDTSIFDDYKNVKSMLRVGIRPKIEDDTVHRDYLDLDVYLYMQIDDTKSAKVKSSLMDRWNVSDVIVWENAIANTKADIVVTSMRETMAELMWCDVDEIPSYGTDQAIIKNHNCFRAASALMMSDVLDLAASKLNATKIIILPSSIHELIVMADDGDQEYDKLNAMVTEINNTQVEPEERLADHIYTYNTTTKKVVYK